MSAWSCATLNIPHITMKGIQNRNGMAGLLLMFRHAVTRIAGLRCDSFL
jgi:hypothetical protein